MALINGTANADTIAPGGISAGVTGGAPGDAVDTINGLGGNDSVDAGGGNDSVDGGDGADTILGGNGDDVLRGGLGNDSVNGDAGFDILALGGDLNTGVTVVMTGQGAGTATTAAAGTDSFAGIEVISPGNFNDSLAGFAGANAPTYFRGGGGNDTIDGANNAFNVADYINSANSVIVDLAAGTVVAALPAGVGAVGTDTLVNVRGVRGSSSNSDVFKGAATGNYTIDGGSIGGSGGDYLDYRGIAGPITLSGLGNGNGASVFFSGTVTKPGGTDAFFAIRGIYATAGNDSLAGTTSTVGQQNFLIRGMAGNDTITGLDSPLNVADYYHSPGAVDVDLGAGTASDGHGGTDSLSGVHRARGSEAGSDTITGSSVPGFNNFFWGTAGNDRYEGGSQFNTVDYAGLGQEGFSGGNLEVTFLAPNAGLFGGGRATVLKAGGTQTDTLENVNQVNGSAGLGGTTGNDTLRGVTGDVAYSWFNQTLRGNAGDDVIHGYNVSGNRADYSNAAAAIVVDLQVSVDGEGNRIGSAASAVGTSANIGTDTLIAVRQVRGSSFNDTLTGSDLSDVFVVQNGGSQLVDGRDGPLNEIRFAGTDSVTIDLGTVAAPGGFGGFEGSIAKPGGTVTLRNIAVAQGGAGNDTVLGTSADNVLGGGSGSNLIDGRGGQDTVSYRFFTGIAIPTKGAVIALNDGVTGTATNPWDGTDTLLSIESATGTQFADTITGASLGGGLRSYIRGDGGNDRLVGNGASVSADYTAALAGVVVNLATGLTSDDGWFGGQDTLVGVLGARGSAFNDAITGSTGANRLEGAAGNDTQNGGLGADTLDGGDGDDVLIGGGGADSLLGGAGIDTASYETATGAIVASLSSPGTNAGDAVGDSYNGIENLRGSAFADRLVTAAGANRLEGLAGNDTLLGGSGADTLDGGTNTLSGDLVSYENAGPGLVVSLAAPGANTGDAAGDVYIGIEGVRGSAHADSLIGDAAANRFSGSGGNDTLSGGDNSDTLIGGLGADSLVGGNGADWASYEAASAGVTVFLLNPAANTGEAAGDVYSGVELLRGSAFGDRLTAGVGPNTVEALDGADTVDAGGGDDRVIGGLGADRLTGAAGADTFVWKLAAESLVASPDLVTDFSKAQLDRIDLSGIDARPGIAGDQAFAFVGTGAFAGGGVGSVRYRQDVGDTVVEVDTGDGAIDMAIRLTGIIVLVQGDFVL